MTISVIIADDHQMMRDGLKAYLQDKPEMDVVGEAGDGITTLDLVRELQPDILILDVGMPDMDGIETAKAITALGLPTKILALSMHSSKRFVTEMLASGASGYILKEAAMKEIIKAIDVVLSGKTYLSASLVDMVVEDYVLRISPEGKSELSKLTPRETEILQLIVDGKSSKEIASDLNISIKTADAHRLQIMRKLNINNVVELIKFAIRMGMTEA